MAFRVRARRDAAFDRVFELLSEGNRPWCARAGALIVVLSKKTFDDGRTSPTHSYDTGAAWMSLALQGSRWGWWCTAWPASTTIAPARDLGVPEDYKVEAMIAVGHPGNSSIFRKGIGLAKSRACAGR